jgi:NADPH2:quinone reductase
MRAIVITRPGDLDSLEVREVATPEPAANHVRVRVHACGLNRADLLQAKGFYPAPPGYPPDIPGLEFAGEVESIGPDGTGDLKVGDRVFGIIGGGAFAEYVTRPAGMLARIPANLEYVQAAAVPESFMTALDALDNQGQIRPGDRVLIHAIGSGVGSAALQIAGMRTTRLIGTSRTAAKLERAKNLGQFLAINTSSEDFAQVIRDGTGGAGVDIILDFLGAPALEANLASLATRGRLVLIGLLGGSLASLDLRTLMAKRLTVVGTTLRGRPIQQKVALTRQFEQTVVGRLEDGTLSPVVDRVYAFEEIAQATARMSSNLGFGKVILRL